MKNEKGSPWFILILSLAFAILLYYNANSITLTDTKNNSLNHIEATAENIPINITYNQDKYFISGYSETVDVLLSSTNKILLDKESNAETRSFSVVMDLTQYDPGEHEVPLEIIGLPNSVKGTLTPNKMNVVIDPKATTMISVEPAVDKSIYEDGYETTQVMVDPTDVQVSGSQDTINEIDRVIAGVSDRKNVTKDFTEKVKPYAINKEGELLNVNFQPETVTVNVGVSALSKRVKVTPVQTGTIPSGIKDYTFSIQNDTVEIFGAKDILDEINGIDLKIDTSNIRETATNSYTVVVPRGVVVSPETVTVTVKPNVLSKNE